MRQIVYPPADRRPCEVLVDGVWRYGEVRMWDQREDGWWANVQWQPARGESTRLGNFPAGQIRELTPETWARYVPEHVARGDGAAGGP